MAAPLLSQSAAKTPFSHRWARITQIKSYLFAAHYSKHIRKSEESHKHPVRLVLLLFRQLIKRIPEISHRDLLPLVAYRIHAGFGDEDL